MDGTQEVKKVDEIKKSLHKKWEIEVINTRLDGNYVVKFKWKKGVQGEQYYLRGDLEKKRTSVLADLNNIGSMHPTEYRQATKYIEELVDNDLADIANGYASDYIKDETLKRTALKAYEGILEYVENNRQLFPDRSMNTYDEKYHQGVVFNNHKSIGGYSGAVYGVDAHSIDVVLQGALCKNIINQKIQIFKILKSEGLLIATEQGRYTMKQSLREDIKQENRGYVYIFKTREEV